MFGAARQLFSRVGLPTLLLFAGTGVAVAQLPDGPGKDVVVKVCTPCHEPNRAAALRLTREGWEQTVADMRWRGAKGTDEEFAQIVEYLVANFLGEAPAKLNMNRATAVELESVGANLGPLREARSDVCAVRESRQNNCGANSIR